jgi:hypothetical protein
LGVVLVEVKATSGSQLRKPQKWKQLQPGCSTVASYKNLKQNHQAQTQHMVYTHTGQNEGEKDRV